jgi:preprotein translocase subunit SecE
VSPRPTGGRGGRPTRFARESISELRKVLWPSRNELVTYSIVVIVFVVIMVSIVAGLDIGFAKLVLLVFG